MLISFHRVNVVEPLMVYYIVSAFEYWPCALFSQVRLCIDSRMGMEEI